jgi:hypothetical protein
MSQPNQILVRPQTLVAVRDVKASSAWYQALLGVRSSGDPEHPHRLRYDRLVSGDQLILPNLTDPDKGPCGHGVQLWFEVDDFPWNVPGSWAPRSSRSRTSIRHRNIESCGCEIRTGTWWSWRARTAKPRSGQSNGPQRPPLQRSPGPHELNASAQLAP